MLNCKFCGREARSYVQLGDDVTYRHNEGDECSNVARTLTHIELVEKLLDDQDARRERWRSLVH